MMSLEISCGYFHMAGEADLVGNIADYCTNYEAVEDKGKECKNFVQRATSDLGQCLGCENLRFEIVEVEMTYNESFVAREKSLDKFSNLVMNGLNKCKQRQWKGDFFMGSNYSYVNQCMELIKRSGWDLEWKLKYLDKLDEQIQKIVSFNEIRYESVEDNEGSPEYINASMSRNEMNDIVSSLKTFRNSLENPTSKSSLKGFLDNDMEII